MLQITDLTNDPNQSLDQTLESGETFNLTLNYSENANCWFFNLTYGTFVLNGCRLVLSSNLLKQWSRILPFGLVCFTDAPAPLQQDPFLINDFVDITGGNNPRIQLFVLTQAEVTTLQNAIGQV